MRLATALIICFVGIWLVFGGRNVVFGSSTPMYYGGSGGEISGLVVSPFGNVVDWSQIHATYGNHTFEAFSGFSGFYLMRLPAGTYNVSVYDFYNPSYWAPTVNVTVTNGSSTTVNFFLQQPSPPAVPEFQPSAAVAVALIAIIAAGTLSKRTKRREVSR